MGANAAAVDGAGVGDPPSEPDDPLEQPTRLKRTTRNADSPVREAGRLGETLRKRNKRVPFPFEGEQDEWQCRC